METKPFSLQSPEQIAKDYGGNKQKIAEAMQMGIVDPTAGTLAAMFIDRMRSAAQAEAAPQQTVAQQVFTPPQPQAAAPAAVPPAAPTGAPAGLGATPEAAQMPAQQMGPVPTAPEGMADGGDVTSRYRLPHLDEDKHQSIEDIIRALTGEGAHQKVGKGDVHARYSPLDKRSDYGADYPLNDLTSLFAGASGEHGVRPEEFHIGVRHKFADGGMTPPYMAGGGLSDLPVPDTIFDEPSNGGFNDGYAGGGIIAFADGGAFENEFDATFAKPQAAAPSFYGYNPADPMANAGIYEKLFGKPQTKYADEYEKELLAERSPEARKRAKDQALGYALMTMGGKMASTPGSLFQSASAALSEGAPILAQSAKEQKAEERELRKGLLDLEAGRNTAAAQKAAGLLQMQGLGIQGLEAQKGRDAQTAIELLRQKGDLALENLKQGHADYRAGLHSSGSSGSNGKPLSNAQKTERLQRLEKQAGEALKTALAYDKANNPGYTERALHQYGQIRNAYRDIATSAGMPELPKPDFGAFRNYNKYVTTRGSHPSGAVHGGRNPSGSQVESGRIVGVQDIPKTR